MRGHADSIALRGSPATIRRSIAALQPGGQQARAVFEAVEQARVEAIGARRMQGVAHNLTAMLDDRFHRGKFDEITDRADAPIEDALALIVRERLTGQARRRRRASWSTCGGRGSRTAPAAISIGSRRWSRTSAASPTPCMTCSIRSTWATSAAANSEDEEDESDGDSQGREDESAGDGEAKESEDAEGMTLEEAEMSADDLPESASEALDADSADMPDDADMGDAETPNEPWRPRHHGAERAARARLPAVHRQVRRDDRRRGSVRAGGARAPARLSRQAALAPAGRRGAPRQPAAAPPAGAAEPRLGIRPRRGRARPGAPVARHRRSAPSAVVQAREGHQLPRHRGDAAARQFRLDARPADHGRGDLRRHPGAHARALRRQGGDPRLHHARLEGRAVARSLARRRQAAEPGPAQRSAPHHLQGGRRAVAARAQESRPDDARGPAQGEHRRRGARLGAPAPARHGRRAARS